MDSALVPDATTPAVTVPVLLHVSGHSPQPPAAAIGMKQIATTKMATPIRVFDAENMRTSKQSSCPSLGPADSQHRMRDRLRVGFWLNDE